jgi:hypothetical protein
MEVEEIIPEIESGETKTQTHKKKDQSKFQNQLLTCLT